MTLLKISELCIDAKTARLVDNVSLEIKRGEILSIVGESGSGKSLTCLSILNLLPKNLKAVGSIRYFEKDGTDTELLGMNSKLRKTFALKKIAYIFQEPLSALNPVQTCGRQLIENISICGINDKVKQLKRAKELLKMVELHDTEKVLNAYPFSLSGGQRQRVMIAMAMAGNPDLIIADEPTTALDVLLQDEILGLIRRLCKEQGKSVLFVSHDLDAVKQFSDRILVMYKGKVVEEGKSDDIINTPKHTYTKALLACKPRPEHKGKALKTISDFENENSIDRIFEEANTSDENIVAAHLLRKEYKQGDKVYRALKPVSFEIRKGQSVGLIGESGSGKSTISRLLVKLEEDSGGIVKYDFENNKPLASNVQLIFQDPFAALNPTINVEDMLEEVIRHHQKELRGKNVREEAINLLNRVGLSETDLSKYPSDFSGGQRQRLCIARALAAKPKLLICDESTSALDLSVQAQILNLLKELQVTEELSVLMITHSMAVAAWFCSYLIVLKNGYIIEQGNTEVLIERPSNDYTRAMVEHI